jgi:hypothetical protein
MTAEELKDVRIKISLESWIVIRAHAETANMEINELCRSIIDDFAQKQLHEAKLISKLRRIEGLPGLDGSDDVGRRR